MSRVRQREECARILLPRLHRGERVGEYVIRSHLGEGELSDIYCATRKGHGEELALKVFLPEMLSNLPDPVLTRGIPSLVEILEVGRCRIHDVAYASMRLVHGHNLAETLAAFVAAGRRPTLPERRLLVERFAEIASALAALHDRGITHCDVKPENILVEGAVDPLHLEGAAMLIDLGVARETGLLGVGSTLRFTPAYAAPEQRLGIQVDRRTDVFSLGVAMHDLLLGEAPEGRPQPTAVGLDALRVIDPRIDSDLSAIVAECIEPDACFRYADAHALVRDLRLWLAGGRPTVRPLSPIPRLWRVVQRRPRTTLRIIAVAIPTLIALGAGLALALSWHADAVHERLLRDGIQAGDLTRVAGELGRDPLAGLARMRAAADVADVIDRLHVGDAPGARRLAAALLSRDGFENQPVLGRWLAVQLDERDVQSETCRLLARAFYDHPPIRDVTAMVDPDRLLRVLSSTADWQALHALTALSAFGDPGVGDAVLTAVKGIAARHPLRPELLRLCVESLHRLSAGRGAAAPAQLDRAEALLGSMLEYLARQDDLASLRGVIEGPVESWLLTVRRMRSASGMERRPWPAHAELFAPTAGLRGILRDPALLADVQGGRLQGVDRVAWYAIGVALGYYDPTDDEMERIRAHLASRWTKAIEAGFARGQWLLSHPEMRWSVDSGSRLADEMVPAGVAEPVNVQVGPTCHDAALATWSLLTIPPTLHGTARTMRKRQARLEFDESAPPVPFCWLGSPGRSELWLDFDVPDRAHGSLNLHVQGQKGMRGSFPFGGEATVEVFVDEEFQAELSEFNTSESQSLPLPLSKVLPGRAHTIVLRLGGRSTTTTRLYEVWID